MKTMKGPAIFLAQFVGDEKPYNSLSEIAKWAASLGFEGLQIPSWDQRLFDLDQASESKGYCDDLQGMLKELVSISLSSQPIFRGNWWRCILLMMKCLTVLLLQKFEVIPQQDRNGQFLNY